MATATSDSEVDNPPSTSQNLTTYINLEKETSGSIDSRTRAKSRCGTQNAGKDSYNLRPRGEIYIPREGSEDYVPVAPSRHWTQGGRQTVGKRVKPKRQTESDRSRDTSPDVEPGYKSDKLIDSHMELINPHEQDQNQTNTSTWSYVPYHNVTNTDRTELSHTQSDNKTHTEQGQDGNQLQDPENAQCLSGGQLEGRPSRARRPEFAETDEQR